MSTNLSPVVCKNETQVADAAFDGVRRRPVVAINDEGKLVVCCRRTAAKNGWEVQNTMFQRDRKPAPAKKTVIAAVKEVVDSELGDLL